MTRCLQDIFCLFWTNKPFFDAFGFISGMLFFKIAIQNIMARKRQFP